MDVNEEGDARKNALDWAIECGHVEIVKRLLAEKNNYLKSNKTSSDPTLHSILEERYQQIKKVISAIDKNDINQLNILLKSGFNIDTRFDVSSDEQAVSAIIHAANKKNLKIVAFFKSKNASKEDTDKAFKKLNYNEQNEAQQYLDELNRYVPLIPPVVYYLIIKTETPEPEKESALHQLFSRLFDLYLPLYGDKDNYLSVIYLRPIIQVYCCHNPSIKFDYESKSVVRMHHSATPTARGLAVSRTERVYSYGKDVEIKQIRGTIIHEFAHMISNILWRNESHPYQKNTHEETSYITAYEEVKNKYENKIEIDDVLKWVFDNYSKHQDPQQNREEQLAELIVRVPHMLALYGDEAITKLETQAPLLLKYYREIFLPKCREYILHNQHKLAKIGDELIAYLNTIRAEDPDQLVIMAAHLSEKGKYREAEKLLEDADKKAHEDNALSADKNLQISIQYQRSKIKAAQDSLITEIQKQLEVLKNENEPDLAINLADHVLALVDELPVESSSILGNPDEIRAFACSNLASSYWKKSQDETVTLTKIEIISYKKKAMTNLIEIGFLNCNQETKEQAKKILTDWIEGIFIIPVPPSQNINSFWHIYDEDRTKVKAGLTQSTNDEEVKKQLSQ